MRVWNEGHTALICDAVPGTPVLEVCNGWDDDCDGVVDNGASLCSAGYTCMGGACVLNQQCDDIDGDGYSICNGDCDDSNPAINPGAQEVCDGLDNDCNGQTDEYLGMTICGVGQCQRTVSNCVDGQSQECTPGTPSPEVCNLLDDDCDGVVDEGAICSNGGECIAGQCIGNCIPNPCDTPPPLCSDNILTTYGGPGECTPTSTGYICDPASTSTITDCGEMGKICYNGQCVADPCIPNPCTVPPPASCQSDQYLITSAVPGGCIPSGAEPYCEYSPALTDCFAQGKVCSDGQCISPSCAPDSCIDPPMPECSGNTVITYGSPGECSITNSGILCNYPSTGTECSIEGKVCSFGMSECVADMCTPNPCNSPPSAPVCVGTTIRTYYGPGTCWNYLGQADCSYPYTSGTDCAALGEDWTCQNGGCINSGCAALLTCVTNCGSNQECKDACYDSASEIALSRFSTLMDCVYENCPDPTFECMQQSCNWEYETCMSS
jgi:hypothetical protein